MNRQDGQDERSEKLALIGFELALFGFELALFFFQIAVFGAKSGEIGFVLHKKVFLCDRPDGA